MNFQYFSSHINLHNFGIHDVVSKNATMFMYPENFALKGSNEVASCLLWYIQNQIPTVENKLFLFLDNSAGQNKNRIVFALLQYLAITRFESVTVIFPVPGHSYMPIDQDFSIIEKKIKKENRVLSPSQWTQLIVNARNNQPFNLAYVLHPFTPNLEPDGRPIIKIRNFRESLAPLLNTRLFLNGINKIIFRNDFSCLTSRVLSRECEVPLAIL